MVNNISFKGFNNILCAFKVPAGNKEVSYITMQLNDNDGHRDLSELSRIREMQGYPIGLRNSDVLTLTYVVDKKNKTQNLYLGSKEMFWGEELKQIEEKYIDKMISKERYDKELKIHMKLYTLLADLTKRISVLGIENENRERMGVIESIYETFCNIKSKDLPIFSISDAFELTLAGASKRIKPQNLALGFNKLLAQSMSHYFR